MDVKKMDFCAYAISTKISRLLVSCVLCFRFTLSIWLYILEYCPEAVVPGQLCSIMYHLNQNTAYRTPLLFLTPEGNGT